MSPLFSLVLATYGRAEVLDLLIGSLASQTCRDFELIVVDQNKDGRIQRYVEQAQAAGITVKWLRLAVPNLSAARNVGLANACGEWVAFPDDDCWYESDALAAVQSCAAAEIDGFVINWVEQAAASGVTEPQSQLDYGRWRRYRGGDASSITLFIRRSCINRVGGFDERLGVGQFFGAGEEIDFIIRLLGAGASIVRNMHSRVHHRYGGQQPTPEAMLNRARGTGALYAKHHLDVFVIVRGLLAPLFNVLLRRPSRLKIAVAWAVARGRWQGWRQWSDG